MKPMIRSLSPMLLALLTGLSASAAFAQNGSPPGSRPADPMPTSDPMQRTEPPVNDPRRDARTPPPSDAIGPATFTELAAQATLPVFALGGLDEEDLETARMAGAQGIAAIRGLWPVHHAFAAG